jgi:hypothetical protein
MSQTRKQQTNPISTPIVVPKVTVVPEVKEEDYEQWMTGLYLKTLMSQDELKNFWEAVSYKGFNRTDVLKELFVSFRDQKVAIQLILVTAIRGPQAAAHIKLLNGRSAAEMGVPASGGKGTKALTLNKILAATADLAAFYLKIMRVPKRMNIDLPAWLQFPSAGSIKLPKELRIQHRDFAKRFSELIGGTFQEQIYEQMEINSYLDETLGLFN